jgi:hypothetical protein
MIVNYAPSIFLTLWTRHQWYVPQLCGYHSFRIVCWSPRSMRFHFWIQCGTPLAESVRR